jgi:hypothetical protein
MANPLKDLKKLLSDSENAYTGTVIKIENGVAHISTPMGVRRAVAPMSVAKGHTVRVERGNITGRTSSGPTKTFQV